MPIYEFTCKDCSTTFSKKSSVAEKDNITCPECNSKELKQSFTSEAKSDSKSKSACNMLLNKNLFSGG